MAPQTVMIGKDWSNGKTLQSNKPRTSPKPTRSKKGPVLVDIQFADSDEAVSANVDKYALKRYSGAAQQQLDKNTAKSTPSLHNVVLILPVMGEKAPSKEAVQVVVDWMLQNKNEPRPSALLPEKVGGSIKFKVEVIMAFASFATMFQPHKIYAHLQGLIRDAAINAEDLEALWMLLPRDDKLVTAAVQSLTYYYNKGLIGDEQNEAVEEYMLSQPDLLKRFEDEHYRQQALRSVKSSGQGGDGVANVDGNEQKELHDGLRKLSLWGGAEVLERGKRARSVPRYR